ERPEHVTAWHAAARGDMPDWQQLLSGYAAAVDWPASAFWPEIAAAFPDVPILLSTRDAEGWWTSASNTIFPAIGRNDNDWRRIMHALLASRFPSRVDDKPASIAAFEAHNRHVRATAPAARLVEWQPGDGWGPLCAALSVPVPDAPFPHANTTE